MSLEDQVAALTDRVQRLEASIQGLLTQVSIAEANKAVTSTPLPAVDVVYSTITLLTEDGHRLDGAHIKSDIKIGSSLVQPTRWWLDGEELGIFDYGWYDVDIPEGDHTMRIETLDGSLYDMVEFMIVP